MAQRSIMTLHEKGFVVKGEDGNCRVRKVLSIGVFPDIRYNSSEIVGEVTSFSRNTCSEAASVMQAPRHGLGGKAEPWPGNGFSKVCVLTSYVDAAGISKPSSGLYESLVYGGTWKMFRKDNGTWDGRPATAAELVPCPTSTPTNTPTNAPSPSVSFTSIDKNLDWRIIVAISILVLLTFFIIYKFAYK